MKQETNIEDINLPGNDLLDSYNDVSGMKEIQEALQKIEDLKENPNAEIKEDDNSNEEIATEENAIIEDVVNDESEDSEEKFEIKKDKKQDKYRKLQNDKYRALAEKAAAEERIKELEHMLNESMSSGTYHYGKNVYSELERAKELKKKALNEGDTDALIEADIALTKAISQANELERWADSQATQQSKPSIPTTNFDYKIKEEMAQDWLENHPYLQPYSRAYNSKLANQVSKFINYLDYDLKQKNQESVSYSPEYFNVIDNYIETIKNSSSSSNALPQVGSVRNSYGSVTNSAPKKQITLNADEKKIASMMGLTPEQWIKYKEEDIKENRKRL